jgi:uncharacterized protein (TIGR03083 family)
MTRDELDSALGAWALDALDEATRAQVERGLLAFPDLARRADGLGRVPALLGESLATAPPAELRDRVLGAATSRSAASRVTPSTPLEVFEHQVADLQALLASLEPHEWAADAAPYAWTVHGLVAHLLVIERYTAQQLGFGDVGGYEPDEHHLALGADEIRHELTRAPRDTATAWDRRASATIDALRADPEMDAGRQAIMHGWPFTVGSILIARGFEVWTHADDIRRAVGRPLASPSAADLRAMSAFSVASLPLLVPIVEPLVPVGPSRVVLTGAGGGTFDLPGAHGETGRQVTLVSDIVDDCRVGARGVAPDGLEATIEGDGQRADALLAAARVFAM